MGNLNEILSAEEKEGGHPHHPSSSLGLSHVMMTFGLLDLGYNNNKFTWTNKREGTTNIKERLERAIAKTKWQELLPRATLFNLSTSASDHDPILLNSNGELYKKTKQFRFEEMWLRHLAC